MAQEIIRCPNSGQERPLKGAAQFAQFTSGTVMPMRSAAPEPSWGRPHRTTPRGIPAFAPLRESVMVNLFLSPGANLDFKHGRLGFNNRLTVDSRVTAACSDYHDRSGLFRIPSRSTGSAWLGMPLSGPCRACRYYSHSRYTWCLRRRGLAMMGPVTLAV
jgi:hypothetical protein